MECGFQGYPLTYGMDRTLGYRGPKEKQLGDECDENLGMDKFGSVYKAVDKD